VLRSYTEAQTECHEVIENIASFLADRIAPFVLSYLRTNLVKKFYGFEQQRGALTARILEYVLAPIQVVYELLGQIKQGFPAR
jgi:hypothetical protein